jgi:hypothetical protein
MDKLGLLRGMAGALHSALARHIIDGLWLLALVSYAFAGMSLAPFHGDESMHIYSSHDFTAAILQAHPETLETHPPYVVDSDAHLRLMNGSVARYAIGLAWYLAGMQDSNLPHLWSWPESYDANLVAGNLPSDQLLLVARVPSTLFLGLGILVMFSLGRLFSGRPGAYLASGLYGLNPVVLLNERRAMMEGSMLFFGLLTIVFAVVLSRSLAGDGRSAGWRSWAALIVSAGLALASKHSAAIFVAAAWGWIALAGLLNRRQVNVLRVWLALAGSAVLALLIFIALSPALWDDPPARFQDLLAQREDLLANQVSADPRAPTTLAERLTGIIEQPFIAQPQYYEAAFWADFAPITAEIRAYETSRLGGILFGRVLGLPLTLLAAWGLVWHSRQVVRSGLAQTDAAGVLIWFAAAAISLLVNPLPWQRYYLPLIPVVCLLAATGLLAAIHSLRALGRPGGKHFDSLS